MRRLRAPRRSRTSGSASAGWVRNCIGVRAAGGIVVNSHGVEVFGVLADELDHFALAVGGILLQAVKLAQFL